MPYIRKLTQNRPDDGDLSAPVSVGERGGDGPDPEGDPDEDGGDEGDEPAALVELLHELHHEDAEGVGDAIGWKRGRKYY